MTSPALRVVVTGGAGFIGTHTVKALLDADAAVLVVDDLRHASYLPLDTGAQLEVADVSQGLARPLIAAFRPQVILHLAAQGGVNRSWRQPGEDARTNVLGTVNVLQAAVDCRCPRVVMASSGGALYGDAQRLPSQEDDPKAPRSPYGTSKLAGEEYLGLYTRTHGVSTCALRYGNVYGPGQDGTGEAGVVAISSYRLMRGQAPEVRGDGLQTRDFVYVGDVAAANVAAVTSDAAGPYNVGTGVQTSVREVVTTLCRLAGFAGEPAQAAAVPEVRNSCLGVSRARERLRWQAKTALRDGLAATYRSFRESG